MSGGREEISPVGLRGGEKQREEKRERKRGRKRKRQGKEIKKDSASSFFGFRCSNDQNSSSRELKSIYAMRAMLQEIGILPPLVISTLRVVWADFYRAALVFPYTLPSVWGWFSIGKKKDFGIMFFI